MPTQKNKKYCVYKHTSPNGKVYIGITCRPNPNKRWANGYGYRSQKHFFNAILKYGWDNFKHEIILSELDEETACKKEVELITEYRSMDPKFGYNTKSGGTIGSTYNEIAREIESKNVKIWWQNLSSEKREYMENHLREIAIKQWKDATQEEKHKRIEPCLRARKAAWDAMTPDERKIVIHKGDAKRKATLEARTPETIAEQKKITSKAQLAKWAKIKSKVAAMTPEEQEAWHKEKADIVRKAWIVRKANMEAAKMLQTKIG